MADQLKRITKPTRAVLSVFMQNPTDEQYGLHIADATGLQSGSLYPILSRLEEHGWLTSRWETIDPEAEGRPRRRYYQLTPGGTTLAKAALAPKRAARNRWAIA